MDQGFKTTKINSFLSHFHAQTSSKGRGKIRILKHGEEEKRKP